MAKQPKKNEKNLPAAATEAGVPAVANMEGDSGSGFEEADVQAYAIPFLALLQSMSPQVNEDKPEYVPGAKPGMLVNTVTGELFSGDEGLMMVPCHYRRSVIQWHDRETGGGFIAEHPANTPLMQQTKRDEKGRDRLDDGTHLVDTRAHYVLVKHGDGPWTPVLISMSSTQTKKSRQLMTRMSSLMVLGASGKHFNPPMFGQMYKIGSVGESNAKGDWKGWKIEYVGLVEDEDLYRQGKEFHEKIKADAARPAYDSVSPGDVASADDGEGAKPF